MNERMTGRNDTRCIGFFSDFHSPKEDGGVWNPNEEYTGWQGRRAERKVSVPCEK